MDLSNKATRDVSSLDKDLEVSSSDDEDFEQSVPMNEEDLLQLSDEESEMPKAQASCSTNFFLNNGTPGASNFGINNGKRVEGSSTRETEVEDGEIEYPDIPDRVLSGNKSIPRPEIEDVDLDEICRQRNIHAPPRGFNQQNRHRFQHDHQFAGARNKLYNINPRENVSLDDIIKRIPLVGLGRDHQTIRRRHHYLGSNGPQVAKQGQNEKLKKGVQSITEPHPEPANPILEPAEPAPDGYPEFEDEPWQCISKLINKGLSIYWCLMKLKNKNHENLNEAEESRLYRCLVSYNKIEGVCEASNMIQAKHGAAVDLLGKLSKEFPNLGRFPGKVNEVFLIKKSVWSTLIRKMKEAHGDEYRYRFNDSNLKVNNRTLFKCELYMGTSKYEGYSYLNARAAKSTAIKIAYEDLLKVACPMDTIHVGVEQCTSDQSVYRDVESHMVHCYDFSRSVVVDPKNVREQLKKTGPGGPPFPRRDTCVPVCYVKPQAGPQI